MKRILALFASITFIFTSFNTSAQLSNIEHFFISSPNAKKLFYFFKDSFHLPVEWKYQEAHDYATGGLTLGETPLEFLRFEKDTSTKTFFAGVALQPTVRVNTLMTIYDSLHVSYGNKYVDTFTEDGVKDTGFINLRITKALLVIFIFLPVIISTGV